MAGNSSFKSSHDDNDFSAIAIEQLVADEWEDVQMVNLPLLAALKDGELNWNNGFTVRRPDILIPVAYENVDGMTTSTLGKSRSELIPTSWPSYSELPGFTDAKFPIAILEWSIPITKIDRDLLKNGERGNKITGMIRAVMGKWARTKSAMMSGNANASDKVLLGIPYALSASNTIGGIAQSTNSWWQALVKSGVSTLLESTVRSDVNELALKARNSQGKGSAPDLLMLDNIDGGFDVYGKVESFVTDKERYFHSDWFLKWGITGYSYKNMKCVMNPWGAGGTYWMLNTGTWYYLGEDDPSADEEIRLPGSSTRDRTWTEPCCLGVGNPRLNLIRSGVTA